MDAAKVIVASIVYADSGNERRRSAIRARRLRSTRQIIRITCIFHPFSSDSRNVVQNATPVIGKAAPKVPLEAENGVEQSE